MRHKTDNNILRKIFCAFFLCTFFVLCPIIVISEDTSKALDNFVVFADQTQKKSNIAQKSKSETAVKTEENSKDEQYKYKAAQKEETSYGGLIFKAFLVIGLLIGGFVLFFRFITQKAGLPKIGRDVVQVLAIAPLSQGKFIQIVDIAGKVMVLGVTDNNINMITEINDKEEIDRIKLASSKSLPASGTSSANFQDFIKDQIGHIAGKFKNKTTSKDRVKSKRNTGNFSKHIKEDQSDDRLEFLRNQKSRLKKLNGHDDE